MKEFFIKPIISPVALVTVVPNIVIAPIVDFYSVVEILVWLFIADLATGLSASYFEWKKNASKGKFFFGGVDGFSSDKFKKCFLKGIIYGGFPLIVLKFQQIFLLKSISISSLTDSQIDITTVCLLVFCANETFSIFWENLPKCGLNIPKKLKEFIVGVKDVANEIKD
jgi:phage-related holin